MDARRAGMATRTRTYSEEVVFYTTVTPYPICKFIPFSTCNTQSCVTKINMFARARAHIQTCTIDTAAFEYLPTQLDKTKNTNGQIRASTSLPLNKQSCVRRPIQSIHVTFHYVRTSNMPSSPSLPHLC